MLVHQWIRSAIRDSAQSASPIGFLFLKLPAAVLLVFVGMNNKESTQVFHILIRRQKESPSKVSRLDLPCALRSGTVSARTPMNASLTLCYCLTCPIVSDLSHSGPDIAEGRRVASFMPQISQMSQKTAVMDSVTIGDLFIFQIDI